MIVPLLLAAKPVPTPTDLEPTDVSPGLAGFLLTFLVVGFTVLLMIDMSRRLRRLRNRQKAAEEIVRQRAEAAAQGKDGSPD